MRIMMNITAMRVIMVDDKEHTQPGVCLTNGVAVVNAMFRLRSASLHQANVDAMVGAVTFAFICRLKAAAAGRNILFTIMTVMVIMMTMTTTTTMMDGDEKEDNGYIFVWITFPIAHRIAFFMIRTMSSMKSIDVVQGSKHVVMMYLTPSDLSDVSSWGTKVER